MVDVHSGKAIRCRDCGEEWDDMPFEHNCPNVQFAEHGAEPYGIALPLNERPWSTRIPAAIEKAEGLLARLPKGHENYGGVNVITATEVALFKALWRCTCWHQEAEVDTHRGDCFDADVSCQGRSCGRCIALITFTEKVESL